MVFLALATRSHKNILALWEHVYSHHLQFYQISVQSHFKYGRQAAILENQLSAWALLTWNFMYY
jgi:hypothetical protein